MLGILSVAAVLRLSQALLRWDEVSWLYSAYPGEITDALEAGEIATALTTFTGLHQAGSGVAPDADDLPPDGVGQAQGFFFPCAALVFLLLLKLPFL